MPSKGEHLRPEQKGNIEGDWRETENHRDAKYYAITRAGERALVKEAERWRRFAGVVDRLLLET